MSLQGSAIQLSATYAISLRTNRKNFPVRAARLAASC